jgi:signal recognition particle GTPase
VTGFESILYRGMVTGFVLTLSDAVVAAGGTVNIMTEVSNLVGRLGIGATIDGSQETDGDLVISTLLHSPTGADSGPPHPSSRHFCFSPRSSP